jgi:pimeloyl-ACP methyl ester carboxylesterase
MIQTLAAKWRGKGQPVVFLHGLGGSSESWLPQLRNLGNTYQCIAPDLPGYGASLYTDPMTFPAWADALEQLLDLMNLDRIVLVGHSLGGMLAQEFMLSRGSRVSELVLSCTSPAFGDKDGDFQRRFVSDRLIPLMNGGTMRDVAEQAVPSLFGPAASASAIHSATATMCDVPEKTYRAALNCLVNFNLRNALAEIKIPTLLLSTEHDRSAPPIVMERMAQKIPGARHVLMPGLGHLPNLEAPKRFDDELRAFIDGV